MRLDSRRKRILSICCGAHAIQDGLSAALYVLLPVLAQAFGLSYAQIGLLRSVNNGAMALLEMSSGLISERLGERNLLAFGLICAGAGYMVLADGNWGADGIWGLAACLFVVGVGGAFQHALSSSIVSSTFETDGRRGALGLYNSSGDAGKLIFTGLFSLAMGLGVAWQGVVSAFGVAAAIGAVVVFFVLSTAAAGGRRPSGISEHQNAKLGWGIQNKTGFAGLCASVFLDTAIQAGFLTFLAFFLAERDVPMSYATLAVTLTLVGGMFGKAACGFLAERIGARTAFALVQGLTACGIVALLYVEKTMAFVLLPVLGMFLQGSTSITYGVVGDIVHADRLSRGFALIYSVSSLSGLMGPIFFGVLGDNFGIETAMFAMALISMLAIPPIILLQLNVAANNGNN
jgi:MFS transporter, FSR family, fosmidomycin resistance protein